MLITAALLISFIGISDVYSVRLTGSSGTFQSPNYPSNYASSTKMVYKFTTPNDIEVTCTDFQLQKKNRRGKCPDFLKLAHSGSSKKFCGTDGPTNYMLTASRRKLLFKSNGNGNYKGFNCTFESVGDETTTSTTTTTTPTTTTLTTTTTPTTTTSTPTTTTTTSTTPTTTTTTPTTTTTTPTTTTTTTTTPTTTTTTPTTTTTTPTTTTTTTTTTTPTTTTSSSTTTTTTTAAATTTAVPALLQSALSAYSSGSCTTRPLDTCGCSGVTSANSEYYNTTDGNYRIIAANGIPSHVYEEGQDKPNPNTACPNPSYMAVPQNPIKGDAYQSYGMGPIGFSFSGGFFYNHLSDNTGTVAEVNEKLSFDSCNGHSDQKCRYHYHKIPKCLAAENSCTHVGYMRDGFPVYTYCMHDTEERYLKSCYQKTSAELDGSNESHYAFNETAKANGDCDLDKANGHTSTKTGGYAYIFTVDYPFIMAGYYGTTLSRICYL